MATGRDYMKRSKGQPLGIDADLAITGAVTLDSTLAVTGATTQTGALGVTGALTYDTGLVCTPATIAANGTLAGKGLYVFNGASASINMPLVSTYDGYTITVANQNGTGTCLLVDDATDSAPLIVNGATAASYSLGTLATVRLTAYAAGTCWFGISG